MCKRRKLLDVAAVAASSLHRLGARRPAVAWRPAGEARRAGAVCGCLAQRKRRRDRGAARAACAAAGRAVAARCEAVAHRGVLAGRLLLAGGWLWSTRRCCARAFGQDGRLSLSGRARCRLLLIRRVLQVHDVLRVFQLWVHVRVHKTSVSRP